MSKHATVASLEKNPEGCPSWQYVFTCAAGQNGDELVMIFGSRTLEDGSKVAIVSPWPTEVPIDDVAMFDRRLVDGSMLDGTRRPKGEA